MQQETIRDGHPGAAVEIPELGLRDRKRIRTKQMIQTEALKLFAERGYGQTTIDDIAHAAAMSPRTFFRYFPTKEDVVLWDEYDEPAYQREFWRPAGSEDPLVHLIATVRYVLAEVYRKDRDLLYARIRLTLGVPEIRARFLDAQMAAAAPVMDQLLGRAAGAPDAFELRVGVAAVYGAMIVAVERWQHDGGRDDIGERFDEAIATLASVSRRLPTVPGRADPGTRRGAGASG